MTEQVENTSGRGKEAILPDSLRGWNWGAFLLNVVWGIGNSTYIALLMFIPFVNIVMLFVLGAKGNRWAWANRPWRDVEHFRRVQRNWTIVGVILVSIFVLSFSGLFFGLISSFKSSVAYTAAIERVRSDPRAIKVLGQPIEVGFLVTGTIKTSGPNGEAALAFSVEGSKAEGEVYTGSIKENGKWRLVKLYLDVPEVNRRFDLSP